MIFFNRSSTQFGLVSKADISENAFLFPAEMLGLEKVKHPTRRSEFIGVRQLRNKMMPKHEIFYLPSGKPTLKESHFQISISHSKHTICLGLSKLNIGIDIEVPKNRILRITSKFCSREEAKLFNEQCIHDMTLLWTLKEAAYKKSDVPGLDFKNEIQIIKREENKHLCRVNSDIEMTEFNLAHEEIHGQILTYTT
ncbi:MAG: 4'-phosphopantetheinyl transferase superfamily protein [Crocinitomicaceae bacterium]|nr:4'-phosphopantetheinyl transferase superfamily protein [Crocinitomicaceae bacterium]